MKWTIESAENWVNLFDSFKELYLEDALQSPFRSPHFLDLILNKEKAEGNNVLLVCGWINEKLVALLPFRKHLLLFSNIWEEEGDHTAFIYHKNLDPNQLIGAFDLILSAYPKAGFVLKNMPYWTPEVEIIAKHLQNKRLCHVLESWPAPILSGEGQVDPQNFLKKAVNKSTIRNLGNRLSKESGYQFEILFREENVEEWAEEFMQKHQTRWNSTATPSEFNVESRRNYFLQKMKAWQKDGVLIRFAIKLNEERIAMCVGLTCKKRIIYHYISHDVRYEKFSAPSVLIRLIVLWMVDHGYEILDFGVGGENYKYRFMNKDTKVLRLYALEKSDFRNLFKLKLDILIRENKTAGKLWDEVVNKFVRIKLRYFINKLKGKTA
jgi:hypothetical protein